MATEDNRLDFLRFSAYSMKDLITRKLSQNSRFTDQIYEGSNLAILIDLVSYMYQCLVYQLNNAASESMFADTQIFTNINRLVKLLGYNVRGCSPASFNATVKLDDGEGAFLPRYATLRTDKYDRYGNRICFSVGSKAVDVDADNYANVSLYNGTWKMYGTAFVASGAENETFVLQNVMSDSSADPPRYVATNFIDVYVRRAGGQDQGKWVKWTNDPNGVFMNQKVDRKVFDMGDVSMYTQQEKYYSAYLNENKTYEIMFGNGVVGSKLERGDVVRVFYLDTNGPDGQIDLTDVDLNKIRFEPCQAGQSISDEDYQQIFGSDRDDPSDLTVSDAAYRLKANGFSVGSFVPEESSDDIRENAPQWFKTGSRLVTRKDYEFYIKNIVYMRDNIPGLVVQDVKCMNNAEYAATFYKWLYLYGKNYHGNGRYYFDQTKFWNRGEFKLADPADANNVYVWIKSTSASTTQDAYELAQSEKFINESLNPIKSMTAEIQVLKPVMVDFDICANMDENDVRERYLGGDAFDQDGESYVEVTLDSGQLLAGDTVRQRVYDAIADYFKVTNCRLGQVVSTAMILQDIYSISGVKNVRTVFMRDGQMRAVNGLSMASWSPALAPVGEGQTGYDDLSIGDATRKLEEFQFPAFSGLSTLLGKIKVITKQLTQVQPTVE